MLPTTGRRKCAVLANMNTKVVMPSVYRYAFVSERAFVHLFRTLLPARAQKKTIPAPPNANGSSMARASGVKSDPKRINTMWVKNEKSGSDCWVHPSLGAPPYHSEEGRRHIVAMEEQDDCNGKPQDPKACKRVS